MGNDRQLLQLSLQWIVRMSRNVQGPSANDRGPKARSKCVPTSVHLCVSLCISVYPGFCILYSPLNNRVIVQTHQSHFYATLNRDLSCYLLDPFCPII